MEPSRVFADGALDGRVAIVTGGGTNLGKAAAAELARCGAVGADRGPARGGARGRPRRRSASGCSWVAGDIRERAGAEAIVRDRARAPRPPGPPAQQRRRPVLRPGRGHHREGLARGPAAERRRDAGDVRGRLRARDAPSRRGDDRQRDRLARTRDSRRWPTPAPPGRRSRRSRASSPQPGPRDGVSVIAVAIGRFATESLRKYPAELWRSAAASVPLQRLGEVEEYGWLVALLASPLGEALSGSVVTIDGGARQLDRPVAAARARPRTARCRPRSEPPAEARRRAPGQVEAADGDRTRVIGLEGRGSTIELPPRRAKCCGCTEAFQASRAGSIPVARPDAAARSPSPR